MLVYGVTDRGLDQHVTKYQTRWETLKAHVAKHKHGRVYFTLLS